MITVARETIIPEVCAAKEEQIRASHELLATYMYDRYSAVER